MTRGLIIGKFLPVHLGHLALIRFAAQQCDELIVSMSYRLDDPIDYLLRYAWLCEIIKDDTRIKVFKMADNFDREELPLDERTKGWAEIIDKVYPKIHMLFSSEEYGAPFAQHLGAENIIFDQQRISVPISASLIRADPFRYWKFIPQVVRPYFVKKICIYGPESTGKSTLAIALAKRFNTTFVPEVAREFLITNDFTVEDIVAIGIAHEVRLKQQALHANKVLFCDTDVITTQIYSKYYLNVVPEILYTLENRTVYNHYFLLDIDVPWVEDGLRDLGHKREEMFSIFKQELDRRSMMYTLLRGSHSERMQQIEHWVIQNLKLQPDH
jgi:HTH-type transcriptional repressor of NAD biosynthesis genes